MAILAFTLPFLSAETGSIRTNSVNVLFETPHLLIAREVIAVYPAVSKELSALLQTGADFIPDIVLAKDRDTFRRMTGSDIIIAFAVPDENLIVLEPSRVYTKPFTLKATLTHELCHLLLHRDVQAGSVPRWLDEGTCQWASGGIAELMAEDAEKALVSAVLAERLIDMRELNQFPPDEKSLVLAYEESRSFVEYLVSAYGEKSLVQVFGYLRSGYSPDEAIERSFSGNLEDLEKKWQASLKRKYTWVYYLSSNLYTLLFVAAAIITIFGFVRLLKKKREYKDEEEPEGGSEER